MERNRDLYGELNEREQFYRRSLSLSKKNLLEVVSNMMKWQKQDGSFSLVDPIRIERDCAWAYIYLPTYYCTALMMKADLLEPAEKGSARYESFRRALEFCEGMKLYGTGYSAMNGRVKAMYIFANAGLFEWMQKETNKELEFVKLIEEIIETMEKAVEEGNTVFDWDEDFEKDFTELLDQYYKVVLPEDKKVWYVAYGSNINYSRFEEYLDQCSNTNGPLEIRPYEIPHSIYFAGKSIRWNRGGVAFLNHRRPGFSYGRAYKITMGQLNDVQKMEGIQYQKRVALGELDGIPVYTFTNDRMLTASAPDKSYLDKIYDGLKETYPTVEDKNLKYYLYGCILEKEQLMILDVLRNAEHGMSLFEITEVLNMTLTNLRKYMKPMARKLMLIKQDRRSIAAGCKDDDGKAVYFRKKEERKVIDLLILNMKMSIGV